MNEPIKQMEYYYKDEHCPYCHRVLRNYTGIYDCYCKFCGGHIDRKNLKIIGKGEEVSCSQGSES